MPVSTEGPEPSSVGRGSPASVAPTFGRLAVCLDGSEIAERIVPHALAVARSLGGPVTFLRVLEGEAIGGAPADPLAWEIRRRESRDYLERAAARSDGKGAVDTEVIEGKAAEEICLWTRQHGVALTVLCSHGGSGKTEWGLASTARKLVEGAPGSFLLVPAGLVAKERIARYRRVLVPVDGSSRAESVLTLAKRLAEAQGAELILAHVVPVPELTEIGPLDSEALDLRERLVRRNERVANEYLDRLRAKLSGSEARVRTLVLRGGDVRSRLARLIAEEDVDFVALSAHGRTARPDVTLGSVASYLVENATTPLLLVRRAAAMPMRRVTRVERDRVRISNPATP